MLQNLTRFLLTQIASDFRRMLPGSDAMEEALATSGVTFMRCMQCRSETSRAVSTYVNNLKYPAPVSYNALLVQTFEIVELISTIAETVNQGRKATQNHIFSSLKVERRAGFIH